MLAHLKTFDNRAEPARKEKTKQTDNKSVQYFFKKE